MEKKQILCLDLDGTVRRSKSGKTFIEGPEDIELIPGVKERVWPYKHKGWAVLGISNQAGIAFGFKTPESVAAEMARTMELMEIDGDDLFHMIYISPADPRGGVEPYNWRSLGRKPEIGMLAQAELSLTGEGIYPDWDNSLFVGDRPEDEECAKRAGIPFMHIDEFLKQAI